MYSKSQRTGVSEGSASGKSSQAGDNSAGDEFDEEAGDKSMATEAVKADPVIMAFTTMFDNIKEGIDTSAEQKLYALEIQQRLHRKVTAQNMTMEGFNS